MIAQLQQVTYSEEQLVSGIQKQENEAYSYLYQHYAPALYAVIRGIVKDDHLAGDIMQDVFIKIYRNIHQYNPCKGRLFTWMHKLAQNTSIDKIRSSYYTNMKNTYPVEEFDTPVTYSNDNLDLQRVMLKLKKIHRQVVYMAYYRGYKLNEISEELELPLGTVKTYMRSAISLLRKHYCISQ